MDNKDFSNGYTALSYITTLFNNSEDFQHVYYLILPLYQNVVICFTKTPRHAVDEHFLGPLKL